jgi:hypothetical protein
MRRQHRQARLYLNGEAVGTVEAEGSTVSWGFGHFAPDEAFSKFAPLFGAWSLLIHEEDDQASEEALMELRGAELAIDALRAELLWTDTQQRTRIRQVTIDGGLIEWNQSGSPIG